MSFPYDYEAQLNFDCKSLPKLPPTVPAEEAVHQYQEDFFPSEEEFSDVSFRRMLRELRELMHVFQSFLSRLFPMRTAN